MSNFVLLGIEAVLGFFFGVGIGIIFSEIGRIIRKRITAIR